MHPVPRGVLQPHFVFKGTPPETIAPPGRARFLIRTDINWIAVNATRASRHAWRDHTFHELIRASLAVSPNHICNRPLPVLDLSFHMLFVIDMLGASSGLLTDLCHALGNCPSPEQVCERHGWSLAESLRVRRLGLIRNCEGNGRRPVSYTHLRAHET